MVRFKEIGINGKDKGIDELSKRVNIDAVKKMIRDNSESLDDGNRIVCLSLGNVQTLFSDICFMNTNGAIDKDDLECDPFGTILEDMRDYVGSEIVDGEYCILIEDE